MTPRDLPHLRFENNVYICDHCGSRHELRLPKPIDQVSRETSRFIRDHRDCQSKAVTL
ncbi:MAG: hypothetical protein HC933_06330 [Pleurocapsa sp. SU_196_0]|nr:hypothetical protein [Pleurocapsa sp. SU_196_0]